MLCQDVLDICLLYTSKCTLVVRYGRKFGENMYLGLGIAATLLCLWFVNTGRLTLIEFIWAPCVYLCMHALTWRKICLLYTSGECLFTDSCNKDTENAYLCVCVMKKILLVYDEEIPLCDSWSTVSLFL